MVRELFDNPGARARAGGASLERAHSFDEAGFRARLAALYAAR